jgi:hypothetical protein
MKKMYDIFKVLIFLAIVLFPSAIVKGEEIGENIDKIKANTVELVKIKSGVSYVDLNGDGKKDMVVSGYRGHITAHAFSVYSFYVSKKLTQGETLYEWQIVSIGSGGGFAGDDIGKYAISTHQGADCVLREARLVKLKKSSSYYLVIADRLIGKSYADSANIKFLFYRLTYSEDESRFIYEKVKEIESKYKYCDVIEAFEKELEY